MERVINLNPIEAERIHSQLLKICVSKHKARDIEAKSRRIHSIEYVTFGHVHFNALVYNFVLRFWYCAQM